MDQGSDTGSSGEMTVDEATIIDLRDETGAVDQSNDHNTRLRSALFGATESNSAAETLAGERVLARTGRPVRKRTPSDLGYPKGKRSRSFGRPTL